MEKQISIICQGSRGDFQPYLALALELKAAGYKVRLLSFITFQKFAEEYGLEYVVITNNCVEKELSENEAWRKAMFSGSFGDFAKAMNSREEEQQAQILSIAKVFIEEMKSNTPDLLICGTICEYFLYYAQHVLKIPAIEIKLQPGLIYNPKHALSSLPTLPLGLHYYLYIVMLQAAYSQGFAKFDKAMDTIAAQKLSDFYSENEYKKHVIKIVNGRNKTIVCQPSIFKSILTPKASESVVFPGPLIVDVKKQTHPNGDVVGFFGGKTTQEEVDNFIKSRPESKPIYLGWGSMICNTPEFMVTLVSALKRCGERAIVLSSTGLTLDFLKQCTHDEKLISFAEEKILFVKKVAHESLFRRVKCIVHHGGAGTTNAALRSGTPSIITPVILDQFDHAYVLNKLGAGYGFSKNIQKITVEELSEAIMNVSGDVKMKERANEIGERMREENGNQAVVAMIGKFINEPHVIGEQEKDEYNKSNSDPQRYTKLLLLGSAVIVPLIAFAQYYLNVYSFSHVLSFHHYESLRNESL